MLFDFYILAQLLIRTQIHCNFLFNIHFYFSCGYLLGKLSVASSSSLVTSCTVANKTFLPLAELGTDGLTDAIPFGFSRGKEKPAKFSYPLLSD